MKEYPDPKWGHQISSSMTPLGIRVFLHIIDVERYTEEVALMYRDLSVKKVTA
jgi:hypothetical protein